MATATPSTRRGPARRRSSTPGRPGWTRSQPRPASVLPQGAARKVSALVWQAHIPGTYAASGPNREPGRILIPGDGAARIRGLRIACLPGDGGYSTPAACPVSTTSWRYNRQVTSTSIHMARPGPASVPRGHARGHGPLSADTLSSARTISDRRFGRGCHHAFRAAGRTHRSGSARFLSAPQGGTLSMGGCRRRAYCLGS
jgi:hypothetical protein